MEVEPCRFDPGSFLPILWVSSFGLVVSALVSGSFWPTLGLVISTREGLFLPKSICLPYLNPGHFGLCRFGTGRFGQFLGSVVSALVGGSF